MISKLVMITELITKFTRLNFAVHNFIGFNLWNFQLIYFWLSFFCIILGCWWQRRPFPAITYKFGQNLRQFLTPTLMQPAKCKLDRTIENFLSKIGSAAQNNKFIIDISSTEWLATPTARYQKSSNFCPTFILEFCFQIVIISLYYQPIRYRLYR